MYLKILSRSSLVFEIMFFNTCMFLLFYICHSLVLKTTCFSLTNAESFIRSNLFITGLLLFSLLGTYKVWRISKILNSLFYMALIALNMRFLWWELDKVLILIVFFQAIFSFFFMLFWNDELRASYYNPRFSLWDIESGLDKLDVEISGSGQNLCKGHITNWNEKSCFVKLYASKSKLPKEVDLKISFRDVPFKQRAKVVSVLGQGIGYGLIFLPKDSERNNWSHLYSILYDRSYLPEFLL